LSKRPQASIQTRRNLVETITPSKMRQLTVRKRGRASKAPADPPQALKPQKSASSSKNRVSSKVTTIKPPSHTKHVPDPVSSEEDEDLAPEYVKDISNETYTLHKSVMLGDTAIVSDTDFLKYEEFDFRQFETQNIRKLHDVSEKAGHSFEYVSGTATIAAKGVRVCDSIVITVEDNFGWKKAEKGIERYMLSNKKEIIVKLSIVYTKTGEPDSDSSEDDKPPKKKVIALVLLLISGSKKSYR